MSAYLVASIIVYGLGILTIISVCAILTLKLIESAIRFRVKAGARVRQTKEKEGGKL